jgi:hypothetical protein
MVLVAHLDAAIPQRGRASRQRIRISCKPRADPVIHQMNPNTNVDTNR